LAVLLVSLAGSAFGAGTFATFNASTTNAGSTFASGTLVLKNTIAATTCFSNGTTSSGAGASTDANANATCNAAFTVATRKPGDESTVNMTLVNDGSLTAASGLKTYGTGTCANGITAEAYHGTGNMCEQLMLKIEDSAGGAGACKWGGGSSKTLYGTVAGGAVNYLTTGTVIGPTNDQFTLTINSTPYAATITNGTYSYSTGGVSGTNTTLAGALQAALTAAGAPAVAGVGPDGVVYMAAAAPGDLTTTIANTGGDTTLASLGMTTNSTTAGNAATCTYDPAHSVMSYTKAFPSSAATTLTLVSSFANAASKTYTLGLKLDTNATNNIQGKSATFGMTWSAVQ
jgi:hypothetical protein